MQWMVIFSLIVSMSASAEDFIERVFEGSSTAESITKAKEEIYNLATEETAKELIIEYIGEDKFQRNNSLIKTRIIRQYSKFIPFIKPSSPRIEGEKTLMTVTMRVSLKNLQDLLLQNGLMYEDDGVPVVIPMIHVVDRSQMKSHKWWVAPIGDENTARFVQNMINEMRDEFFRKGFYLMNPVTYDLLSVIPEDYRFDRPRVKDWQIYGQIFKSQIVVYGAVEITRKTLGAERLKIDVKFSAIQTANGRVIAGVSRSFETNAKQFSLAQSMTEWAPKVAKDLSVQILEAWQRGTFGAQLLTLKINRKLNFDQLKAFKEQLKSKSKSIKTIKPRYFDPQFVKLEMDVTKPPSQMIKVFEDFEFFGLRAQVESYDSKEIILNVME